MRLQCEQKSDFFFHLVSVAFPEWSPCSNKMIPATWPTTVLVTCIETTHTHTHTHTQKKNIYTKKYSLKKKIYKKKKNSLYEQKQKPTLHYVGNLFKEDQVSVQPLLVFEFFIILFLKVTIVQTLDFVP